MRRVVFGVLVAATSLAGFGGNASAVCAGRALCAAQSTCYGTVNVCPAAWSCSGGVNVCPGADYCSGTVNVCNLRATVAE